MIMQMINNDDSVNETEIEKIESKVKWYNPEKGYGFLEPLEDGNDIFMHFSVLDAAGFRRVEEGDTIICDIGPGRQGKQVLRVLEVKIMPRDPGRSSPMFPGSRMPYVDPESLEDIQGEIKWFNPLKGFGFICPEDGGRDIFLHASVLRVLGLETVEPGVKVKAKITSSERGREARAIEFLNPYIQNS
jgi:CspA family cold shock protein